ncbi:MAG TPA: hypothetical protein PLW93_00730 [Candidatus Absconditabacterales bacterium]|nr:hypothetical protein [Candidatus Absconditabacterales bacterium]HMY80574.1 hypothetical protein [Candidatus Absconditabacterales bacterium]HNG96775.1 hypothetical protein [Candidatus Absconditabacterales bacterium]
MKEQSYYPYAMHNHFDSPLWKFIENEENSKIVDAICEERLKPIIPYGKIGEKRVGEILTSYKYGLFCKIENDEIYVSGVYLLITRIIEALITKMQNFEFDKDIVVRILLGVMVHRYYTTGKMGDALWDILDEDYRRSINPHNDKPIIAASQRTDLIAFNLEEITKGADEDYITIANFYSKLVKGKLPEVTKKELDASYRTGILGEQLYKFNKEGIDFVKLVFRNRPDIVKGFQQCRIKRIFEYRIRPILTSIVSAVYHTEELFINIDPYFFDVTICDKKNLECNREHVHLVMSFTNIVNSFFCSHCIKKNFGGYELDFSSQIKSQESVKKMFDELYSLVANISPDELLLSAEGKTYNADAIEKLKDEISYGNVGLDRYDGKTTAATFVLKKDLKGYKKKVK